MFLYLEKRSNNYQSCQSQNQKENVMFNNFSLELKSYEYLVVGVLFKFKIETNEN